jgi:hypothetical protein
MPIGIAAGTGGSTISGFAIPGMAVAGPGAAKVGNARGAATTTRP